MIKPRNNIDKAQKIDFQNNDNLYKILCDKNITFIERILCLDRERKRNSES